MENVRYPSRNWALISLGAEAGKSTFVAANARTPAYVIDSDNRFDSVEGLADGEIRYPQNKLGTWHPLRIREQAEEVALSSNVESIVVDSVTKIFSHHARTGSMRNRYGVGNQNKASEMIAKSDVMASLRDLSMFAQDVYYIWHETEGIDNLGQEVVRDMISDVERERLLTSINVILKFKRENGRYGVTVASARDLSGRRANVGFTMWDHEDNYWRGAARRLERLIYTSFSGPTEATKWMGEQLGNDDPGEMRDLYEHIKSERQPEKPGQMWVAVIREVDRLLAERKERTGKENNGKPAQQVQGTDPDHGREPEEKRPLQENVPGQPAEPAVDQEGHGGGRATGGGGDR